MIEQLHKQYGLDKPLIVQYGTYVGKLVTGDLGTDYTQSRPVAEILTPKLENTAKLAVAAIVLDIIIGVAVGVVAAMRRYSIWDMSATFITTLAIGVPSIVLGMILQRVFVVELNWFPLIAGQPQIDGASGFHTGIIDAALVAQLARSTMLEVLRADYVKTAVAKGLPAGLSCSRHILRNSVIPVVTYLGISFGTLLGGAIITETIFNWNGIGLALIQAIQQNNNPIIVGVVTISVAIFVVLNLVVDLLYAALDPRIRLA